MKSVVALLGIVCALSLGGCASSGSPAPAAAHTVKHLWETDREATVEKLRERYPDEARGLDSRDILQAPGVYDMILELNPYDRFVMSVKISGELYEVTGGYRVYPSESGKLVRLFAPTTQNEELPELNRYIRSMVIAIDPSGDRAVVRTLDELDTILRSMD